MNNPVRILLPEDDLSAFDCGIGELNTWLTQRARRNDQAGASRCYVMTIDNQVVGYYALAAASVVRGAAPGRLARNMPDPIPATVLGRLAIDRQHHHQGLGSALLADACRRVLAAADHIGIRTLIVHALDATAATFYTHHGFHPLPENPLHLYVGLDELRKL